MYFNTLFEFRLLAGLLQNKCVGSSALGQGALSSLPSLSEDILSRRSPCIGEKYPTCT